MTQVQLPTFDALMNPLMQALRELGGSGTIEEINRKTIEVAGVSDEQLEILHDAEKGGQTEVEYRLAWTRTYLKKFGLLDNSSRGVWVLTPEGRQTESVNPRDVKRYVRDEAKRSEADEEAHDSMVQPAWRQELLDILLTMEPAAFERLTQRILRESGFVQVEVTGRSGDGGIDGKGILRLAGILSFHVLFQCKRYQGSVTASHVRDFRGALVGRADKGLLITTGNFTKDAEREAVRDGASAIELMDGDQLIDKLKELGLGIKTEIVEKEQITVNGEWFDRV